jgi:histidinol dehydrogenase
LRLVRGIEEGRRLLVGRRGANADVQLPEAVRRKIRRVFGAELDAQAVVERILADVRDGGDAAVRRYNEAIDRVPPSTPLVVPRDEIELACRKLRWM